MSKKDDFFLDYLIKSVSKENILSYVSTFKGNEKDLYNDLFYQLTDIANEFYEEETGEKRVRTDITPTNCFVIDLLGEDIYILGKIGPKTNEHIDSSNEEIWIFRNCKKNKLSSDSNFYSKYNLYENENAKRLIDKIKLINK